MHMPKWNMAIERFKKGVLENYREGIRNGRSHSRWRSLLSTGEALLDGSMR